MVARYDEDKREGCISMFTGCMVGVIAGPLLVGIVYTLFYGVSDRDPQVGMWMFMLGIPLSFISGPVGAFIGSKIDERRKAKQKQDSEH